MVTNNTKDFPNGIWEIIEHNQDACFSLGLNDLLQVFEKFNMQSLIVIKCFKVGAI
jgi:hypothetical protein